MAGHSCLWLQGLLLTFCACPTCLCLDLTSDVMVSVYLEGNSSKGYLTDMASLTCKSECKVSKGLHVTDHM